VYPGFNAGGSSTRLRTWQLEKKKNVSTQRATAVNTEVFNGSFIILGAVLAAFRCPVGCFERASVEPRSGQPAVVVACSEMVTVADSLRHVVLARTGGNVLGAG
jgi:hypothetical protein